MKNYFNCIYCYTNKINNKKYIGQAIDFNKRHKKHIKNAYNLKSHEYNSAFHRAIRKYNGIENFIIEILIENIQTKDELDYWEKYYIKKFNTLIKNNKGYNTAEGGQGGKTLIGKTEEEMKEFREKVSGKNNGKLDKLIDCYDKDGNLLYTKYNFQYVEMGFNETLISSCCTWYACNEDKDKWYKIRKGHPKKSHKGFIFKYH